jgi:hypothetical protein
MVDMVGVKPSDAVTRWGKQLNAYHLKYVQVLVLWYKYKSSHGTGTCTKKPCTSVYPTKENLNLGAYTDQFICPFRFWQSTRLRIILHKKVQLYFNTILYTPNKTPSCSWAVSKCS